MKQEQFLDVVTQEEAERRFRAAVDFAPLEPERVALESALDRVLAADVVSPLDVPGFARTRTSMRAASRRSAGAWAISSSGRS